jgi:stress-induced morphogen
MTQDAQTLTQCLAAGRLSLPDSLRYAMQMADALRRTHEEGHFHGAVTPDSFLLTAAGVRLVPAPPGASEALTPYTAPERLKGQAPDARTDIFGFGAVLYEMLTGRAPFDGERPEALAESIATATPPPIGDAALHRLVFNCLVKDPGGRWQRIQQVQMELKILSFSANRARVAGAARQPDPALAAELRQVESRLSSRLEPQETAMADLRRLAAEHSSGLQTSFQALGAMQAQLVSLEGQLAATRERAERAEKCANEITEGARHETAALQVSLAGELHALELTVKEHTAAIESIRGAMARTDDFMERVVEALESLQTMVLEQVHAPA